MSDKASWTFNVTEQDFEQAVVERSRQTPVVVDFWAPWCGPCKQLGPILEKLIGQRGGQVLLAKVNIDDEQGLAARYSVSSIPTVIAFRDGVPLVDFVGLLPEAQLGQFLDKVCPTEADRKAKDAAALEATNPQQAEKLYRQVLKENSSQEVAVLGLARLLVQRQQDGEAAELLDRLGSGGDQRNEVEKLQAILWLRNQAQSLGAAAGLRERVEIDGKNPQLLYELGAVLAGEGKYEEALETLYQAGQGDKKLAADRVRETMVKIFHALGVRAPLSDAYRDKLTSLLY